MPSCEMRYPQIFLAQQKTTRLKLLENKLVSTGQAAAYRCTLLTRICCRHPMSRSVKAWLAAEYIWPFGRLLDVWSCCCNGPARPSITQQQLPVQFRAWCISVSAFHAIRIDADWRCLESCAASPAASLTSCKAFKLQRMAGAAQGTVPVFLCPTDI